MAQIQIGKPVTSIKSHFIKPNLHQAENSVLKNIGRGIVHIFGDTVIVWEHCIAVIWSWLAPRERHQRRGQTCHVLRYLGPCRPRQQGVFLLVRGVLLKFRISAQSLALLLANHKNDGFESLRLVFIQSAWRHNSVENATPSCVGGKSFEKLYRLQQEICKKVA